MARGLGSADLGLLLLLGGVWGAGFFFIAVGLRDLSPFLLGALRFDVSAFVLLAYAMARSPRAWYPTGRRQWAIVTVVSILNILAYNALLNWGQQFTTAGVAAVIVGLNPVLTTVFSRGLLPDERVGLAGVAGLALGLGGIVVLATLKPGSLLDARGLGELAIVGAIAAWALGSVLVKRSRHGLKVVAFTAWQSLLGAGLLHVGALAFEGGGRMELTWTGATAVLYLALFSGGFGFALYYFLLDRIGPIRVNVVSYLAPVAANLLGIWVLHDPFEWRALAAFALIAVGFYLVTRRTAPHAATSESPGTPTAR